MGCAPGNRKILVTLFRDGEIRQLTAGPDVTQWEVGSLITGFNLEPPDLTSGHGWHWGWRDRLDIAEWQQPPNPDLLQHVWPGLFKTLRDGEASGGSLFRPDPVLTGKDK